MGSNSRHRLSNAFAGLARGLEGMANLRARKEIEKVQAMRAERMESLRHRNSAALLDKEYGLRGAEYDSGRQNRGVAQVRSGTGGVSPFGGYLAGSEDYNKVLRNYQTRLADLRDGAEKSEAYMDEGTRSAEVERTIMAAVLESRNPSVARDLSLANGEGPAIAEARFNAAMSMLGGGSSQPSGQPAGQAAGQGPSMPADRTISVGPIVGGKDTSTVTDSSGVTRPYSSGQGQLPGADMVNSLFEDMRSSNVSDILSGTPLKPPPPGYEPPFSYQRRDTHPAGKPGRRPIDPLPMPQMSVDHPVNLFR